MKKMLERWRKERALRQMYKRMVMFGQIFDTIDATMIQARLSDEARLDFWLKFISKIDFRYQFIQEMVDKNR